MNEIMDVFQNITTVRKAPEIRTAADYATVYLTPAQSELLRMLSSIESDLTEIQKKAIEFEVPILEQLTSLMLKIGALSTAYRKEVGESVVDPRD